jgi:hypothetical protein
MNHVRSFMNTLITGMVIASFILVKQSLASHRNIRVPQELVNVQLTDVQAKGFADNPSSAPTIGSLVIAKQSTCWRFGIVSRVWHNNTYDIIRLDRTTIQTHIAQDSIRSLAPLWHHLYQPNTNLSQLNILLNERITHYKKYGCPGGHGMIVPPSSKIIVLGDINGNFNSLQSQITEMFRNGLIDKHLKLAHDHYIIGLGNYVTDNKESLLVIQIMLQLQQANPSRVYLIKQNIDNIPFPTAKNKNDMQTNSTELQSIKHSWATISLILRTLPNFLCVGLQMPSTHSYDFIIFCSQKLDSSWHPQTYMKSLVEKHIDQNYSFPCCKEFYCTDCKTSSEKPTETFSEFVKKYISGIDSQKAYQCCLKALLRTGIRAGHCGITRICDNNNSWKPLKNYKTYEIGTSTVYTCSSCPIHADSHSENLLEAFGVVEAGRNGHWYITAHIQ